MTRALAVSTLAVAGGLLLAQATTILVGPRLPVSGHASASNRMSACDGADRAVVYYEILRGD